MKIPYDKKLHFIAGLLISFAVSIAINPTCGLIASMLDESYDNKIIKVVIPPNAQEGDYDLAIVAFPNMTHVLFGAQEDYQ